MTVLWKKQCFSFKNYNLKTRFSKKQEKTQNKIIKKFFNKIYLNKIFCGFRGNKKKIFLEIYSIILEKKV